MPPPPPAAALEEEDTEAPERRDLDAGGGLAGAGPASDGSGAAHELAVATTEARNDANRSSAADRAGGEMGVRGGDVFVFVVVVVVGGLVFDVRRRGRALARLRGGLGLLPRRHRAGPPFR